MHDAQGSTDAIAGSRSRYLQRKDWKNHCVQGKSDNLLSSAGQRSRFPTANRNRLERIAAPIIRHSAIYPLVR
jgi:hypothetical protein